MCVINLKWKLILRMKYIYISIASVLLLRMSLVFILLADYLSGMTSRCSLEIILILFDLPS